MTDKRRITRAEYTTDGGGRLFTRQALTDYRSDLCRELETIGKVALACRYRRMTLQQFAANGGYVIIK